ncbi:MAG: carbohydrate-binding family 9-like protein [Flavisolibacter sp.]
MEKLSVSYLNDFNKESVKELSCRMNTLQRHTIGEVLWHGPSLILPKVSFAIAYNDDCILLKYFVQENSILVLHNQDNSPVHLDSCVEFFISFNEESAYYNLEFNSVGTCYFGYGENKDDRSLIEVEDIGKIKRQATIESCVDNGSSMIQWELTIMIPFKVFVFHQLTSLSDVQCKANFYKCGDALPSPHFLAWQKLVSDTPNFHLPQFFGSLHFEKHPILIKTK